MADPFAAALAALHSAAGSVAAIYTPGAGGDPLPLRVIREQPSEMIGLGDGHVVVDTNVVRMRRSDVPQPDAGDRLTIGDKQFVLRGAPELDAEGLTWRCGLQTG